MSGVQCYVVPLTMLHGGGLGPGWADIHTREGSTDRDVIDEIVIRDAYHLRGIDIGPAEFEHPDVGIVSEPRTVIDVGANIGIFAATCVQMGASHVIAVEPQPENLQLLRKNLDRWVNQGRVTIIPAAVGGTTGRTAIAGEGATAYTMDGTGGMIYVDQFTLATIIDSVTTRISILKVDVEGAEYEIFDAVPSTALARCERILVEFHGRKTGTDHLGPDNGRYGRLMSKLAETHAVSAFGPVDDGGMAYCHSYAL